MFGAGLALGLAILARAESWLLLPALAITSFKVRLPARRLFFGGALASVGLVTACAPYWAILGTRQAMDSWQAGRGSEIGEVLNARGGAVSYDSALRWTTADAEPSTFSKKESTVSSRFKGYPAAIGELGRELPRTLQYWVGSLALAGLWARRRSLEIFDCLALIFSVLLIAGATWYAARVGYLSSRHLLLLTPFTAGWAAAGALALGKRFRARVESSQWLAIAQCSWLRAAAAWSVVVVAVAAGLPRVVAPLHASRWGHRQAAEWLTTVAADRGAVLDTRGWTALYTARTTYRFDAAERALADPRLNWLVIEHSEAEIDSPRGGTLRRLVASLGELTQTFYPPGHRDASDAVLLYRLRRNAPVATWTSDLPPLTPGP
jgi:hypothetical protein